MTRTISASLRASLRPFFYPGVLYDFLPFLISSSIKPRKCSGVSPISSVPGWRASPSPPDRASLRSRPCSASDHRSGVPAGRTIRTISIKRSACRPRRCPHLHRGRHALRAPTASPLAAGLDLGNSTGRSRNTILHLLASSRSRGAARDRHVHDIDFCGQLQQFAGQMRRLGTG